MSTGIVGTVAGPIASLPASAGATTYENLKNLYSVAIGGLPFNVAPTDEHPYQRVTAQFRKQQFDSAPNPGDQSLDGLWLRGQFSFHRGAGVKFYEALDGDATDSRFHLSTGLNPWIPGEVTLCPKLTSVSAQNVVDAAARDGLIFAVTSGNAVRKITASTDTLVASGSATTIDTNDQGQTFVTAGAKVQVATTGAFSDLLTQGGGRTFVKVAWAKGRLFAVDDSGRWYAKPATVATVNDADSFWASGFTSVVGDWSVAESPSAVYLGRGSSIYAVIPDTDGAVPVLAAPVVAATLPPGETVKALGHSLGWLVIVTDAGVRVAQSGDNGALDVGPILAEFDDSSCRKVGLWKNLAYVTGTLTDEGHESVVFLDLTRVLETNVVAYTTRAAYSGANTGSGAVFLSGRLATFGSTGVLLESLTAVEDTGSLTTGFIRFGTMEPKAFQSLRLKLDGTEGAVAISLVELNGSETLLTSIAASRFADQDVALNLPAPREALGIKFTFSAGAGGTGPTLLGYQVRALPAPANRTRMIQLPLLCYDSEDARNGVTVTAGKAFERLFALEQMEASAGTVLYQDFRTGEQAECFVEEVSFTNTTSPKRASNGFGGVVLVTLRKLT